MGKKQELLTEIADLKNQIRAICDSHHRTVCKMLDTYSNPPIRVMQRHVDHDVALHVIRVEFSNAGLYVIVEG